MYSEKLAHEFVEIGKFSTCSAGSPGKSCNLSLNVVWWQKLHSFHKGQSFLVRTSRDWTAIGPLWSAIWFTQNLI